MLTGNFCSFEYYTSLKPVTYFLNPVTDWRKSEHTYKFSCEERKEFRNYHEAFLVETPADDDAFDGQGNT
jgi:hypothetical protein